MDFPSKIILGKFLTDKFAGKIRRKFLTENLSKIILGKYPTDIFYQKFPTETFRRKFSVDYFQRITKNPSVKISYDLFSDGILSVGNPSKIDS